MQDARFQRTLKNTRSTLLDYRLPHGHWEGELSSSALSTATAMIALKCYANRTTPIGAGLPDNQKVAHLIKNGLQWLLDSQNKDGGWGDTICSESNISTTALVWGAIASAKEERAKNAERGCEAWLRERAGSLGPDDLSKAIIARYGQDRTFSVPILTALAITGRLGSESSAWDTVPQLPFEIAACPHQWFAALNLPVVSYALPALIAMGKVRHRRRPTRNPVLRAIRNLAWSRTGRKLIDLQPTNGGFLEATPLTSFVLMALLHADGTPQPVIERGVRFLDSSVRPDGSWPIDTNLATWVTTLATNALAIPKGSAGFVDAEFQSVRDWLLRQQYRLVHPFTRARPGGWGWTDLEGSVPDADDTSGTLLALKKFSRSEDLLAAENGLTWLIELQNRDGGIPTFCYGWGTLPFDRSSADITAHAIRAWIAWYASANHNLQKRIDIAIDKAVGFLCKQQRADGAWAPLWFGNQAAAPEENLVYGTSRVLLACAAMHEHRPMNQYANKQYSKLRIGEATSWLVKIQNSDGGWGSEQKIDSSIEETGLAVEALCGVYEAYREHGFAKADLVSLQEGIANALRSGIDYLIQATDEGSVFPPSPIGFYFAKLWYFEQLYPVVFSLAALERFSSLNIKKNS